MEKIKDVELYEECLYVYDDDIDSLSLHVFYIIKQTQKGTTLKNIRNQLLNKLSLERFRFCFLIILDSFKGEIEKFKKIKRIDENIIEVSMLIMFNNINTIKEFDTKRRNRIRTSLINVIFQGERILEELNEKK